MDAQANSRLPNRYVTEGPERAPHRPYCYGIDLNTTQIHQPFVGVAEPKKHEFPFGYLWTYAQKVGPALNGTVTCSGAAAETSTYADF